MLGRILFLSLCVLPIAVNTKIALKPINPDEPVEHTYNTRFSTKNSLRALSSIRDALNSFTKLTKMADGKIPKDSLQKIGNTDWESQVMGFSNWPCSIEGTLLKNDYIIRKLRY